MRGPATHPRPIADRNISEGSIDGTARELEWLEALPALEIPFPPGWEPKALSWLQASAQAGSQAIYRRLLHPP